MPITTSTPPACPTGLSRRTLLRGSAAMLAVAGTGPLRAALGDGADGDVDLVAEALKALHPGLLRYNTPVQIDERLALLRREFTADDTLTGRYLALSRCLSTLQCGHSYANFFNQRDAVKQALFDGPTRLPFTFRWLADEMVVEASHTTTMDLAAGTVVQRIDGAPAIERLRRLMPYTRADGSNPGKRVRQLSVRGRHPYDHFDIFHGLVYGAPARGRFVLDLRPWRFRQRRCPRGASRCRPWTRRPGTQQCPRSQLPANPRGSGAQTRVATPC